MTPEKTLEVAASVLNRETVVKVADTTTIKERKFDIPEIHTYSQAKRVAKFLFGPLVRINPCLDGFSVSVAKNGKNLSVLAAGDTTLRDALQTALDTVRESIKKDGGVPNGVIRYTNGDLTQAMRSNFIFALSSMKDQMNGDAEAAATKLFPHEVLVVDKLSRQVAKAVNADPAVREKVQREASAEILRLLELTNTRPSKRPEPQVA
jgi:hypothetical protein